MIKGAKYWHDKSRLYSQVNNPTESLLHALINERHSWLESCGPTSAVNCLAAIGVDLTISCPGFYSPQPEEVLMDYFNDPRNADVLRAVREVDSSIPGNRVPQFYPTAVEAVFGYVKAAFLWSLGWDGVVKSVSRGAPVQLCLKDPGHYIAAIAYDLDADEIIYNDSWGDRFSDGGGGAHRRMPRAEFESNVQPFFIVYGV